MNAYDEYKRSFISEALIYQGFCDLEFLFFDEKSQKDNIYPNGVSLVVEI